MSFSDKSIHIALAFDQHYYHAALVLFSSIVDNNRNNDIHIHAIATGIDAKLMDWIESILNGNNIQITFYNAELQDLQLFKVSGGWTHSVYYRLLFPIVIDTRIARLIYLDVDTVVVGDLKILNSQNLEGYAVGAVYDNYVKKQERIGIIEDESYFNSGVLVIDLAKWNEDQISQKAFSYLREYPERILFVDQCALNAVLYRKWKRLPERFNLLYSYIQPGISKTEMMLLKENTVVIHYTLQRPWRADCKNRLMYFYQHHFKKSPFLKSESLYRDLSWKQIPAYFKIRLWWLYNDYPCVKNCWRNLKGR